MNKYKLTADESVDGAKSWFSQFGLTDASYMSAHWERYLQTREFALATVAADRCLTVLDMGAHWLHNAFLYGNMGHKLICVDAPDLMESSQILAAAEAMGAEIRVTRRMEKADGLTSLPEGSVDIVLFCEIIEHLAFNPITFWKEIYRVLKPGGRVIITTPNSFYYRSLAERLRRIFDGECFGLSLSEIFETGTYGHHWKEFTLAELQAYFRRLSPDFDPTRHRMIYHSGDTDIEIPGALERLISTKVDIRAFNIYLDVVLTSKKYGVVISPPWDPK